MNQHRRGRILLLTKFRKPWNNGHFMSHALEAMGWEVIRLDTPRDLASLSQALDKGPDIALATKADGMTTQMTEAIRGRGIPFVMWYPDPVPPEGHIVTIGRLSDMFFTMTRGRVADYKRAGITRVRWLTQAFEPDFYPEKPMTSGERDYYGSEVAFVGNLGMLPQYTERRRMLERVVRAGFHLKWWGPRTPRKLRNLPFLLSGVARRYGGEFVALDTFAKVARASKIFLSLDSYPEIELSMSVRIYTAAGCGAFYICRKVPSIEEVMIPGKEIVVFDTYDDMVDKISYYLEHDEEREAIRQAGKSRVLKDHTYQKRFAEMFKALEEEGIFPRC